MHLEERTVFRTDPTQAQHFKQAQLLPQLRRYCGRKEHLAMIVETYQISTTIAGIVL